MTRAPEDVTTSAETADLLEALRRRRGQREPVPAPGADADHDNDPIALFEALGESLEQDEPEPVKETSPAELGDTPHRKRRRESMPSWDEIVFGARTED